VVFATSLALDANQPEVRCHAIEVAVEKAATRPIDLEALREALRDAALVRALRCAGRYETADRASDGYFPDLSQLEPTFTIAGRPMVGNRAEVTFGESRLLAQIGVDLRYLQALGAPRPERGARLEPLTAEIALEARRREPLRTPERVREEALMSDGIGVLFEQWGRLPEEGYEFS
jgi:hypothetical protein